MRDDDRAIVRQDVVVSLTNLTTGLLLAGTLGVAAGRWWVGALVGALVAGLAAAADRSRAGLRALLAVAALGLSAFVWGWTTGAITTDVLPLVLVGVGLGAGLNRLAFGLVRPVPGARRRRQGSS